MRPFRYAYNPNTVPVWWILCSLDKMADFVHKHLDLEIVSEFKGAVGFIG